MELADAGWLRPAEVGDAAAIAEISVRAWRAAYAGIVPQEMLDGLSVHERTADWASRLSGGVDRAQRSHVIVAERDGDLLGFCAASLPTRDDDGDEDTAEIVAVYVDPPAWRSGVGTRLMTASLDALSTIGFTEVTLWVFEANAPAQAFYRRCGFAAEDIGKIDERSGAREIRMRAWL